jgi:hypothetical protein
MSKGRRTGKGRGELGDRRNVTDITELAALHDGIYRLKPGQIIGATVLSPNGTISYSLAPVGNRLSQTSAGIPAIATTSFTYDAGDRIFSTELYDDNGNTTTSGGRTFA